MYKYILLSAISMILISCDGLLDVSQPSSITDTEFWETSSDAEQGVAAIYDAAQSTFGGEILDYGEFRADNFRTNDRPSTNIDQVINNGLTNTHSGSDWGDFYEAIATANTAIHHISEMSDFEGKNNLLAEAHASRALFYFWAVRIWGDLPKRTEPVQRLEDELNLERSPVGEIYSDIIIPDIERAEQLIVTDRNLNRWSLGSILALKAHVYMWPGVHQDYAIASNAISQLESLGYTLETTQEGWTENIFRSQDSDELIFTLAWNYDEDGSNGTIRSLSASAGFYLISEDLRQSWDNIMPNDFRRDVSFDDRTEPLEWDVLQKYAGSGFTDLDQRSNWARNNDRDLIFYRLSGLLLLKAEAENYLGNYGEALSLLNRIRSARGLSEVDESLQDQEEIRDLILEERRFELVGEGHRYWDLVRNELVLDVMEPINGMSDPDEILWPISQNVLTRNPNISQNEGY